MMDRNFGIIGFKDGAGRSRYKPTGALDADSFPTAAEAKAAARRMRQHRASHSTSPALSGKAASTKPAAAAMAVRCTAADVAAARASGVADERKRTQAVFDSPDSAGRERGCVALLTASRAWSAADITKQLASLPTDSQIAAGMVAQAPADQSALDAAWDRARAHSQAQGADKADPTTSASQSGGKSVDDLWARARSRARTGAGR